MIHKIEVYQSSSTEVNKDGINDNKFSQKQDRCTSIGQGCSYFSWTGRGRPSVSVNVHISEQVPRGESLE